MRIGHSQKLPITEFVKQGVLVGSAGRTALLPRRDVPAGAKEGDIVEVFVYPDKEGELIATTLLPFAEVGEFAYLEVLEVSRHGVHLDWGLPRDLFMPFALQHERVRQGDRIVVYVDLDEQGRLFASNKLAAYFDNDVSSLEDGQEVRLLVYGANHLGALVVVNGRYTGMVYKNEQFQRVRTGDDLTGYIKQRRHDGKLDISLRREAQEGVLDARDVIQAALARKGGFLALHDKSKSELIQRELNMSKKQFKKAIGGLYRDRLITLEPDGIRAVDSGE